MLVGRVIDDEVHHELDAARVEPLEQLVEVVQRPEHRLDVLVVADVVAGVVLRRGVDRRQPYDVHAELGEVVEPPDDPAQVADPVAIGVRERPRIDLVDDRALKPRHRPDYAVTIRGRRPRRLARMFTRTSLIAALTLAATALTAPSAHAIVNGRTAAAGDFPFMAQVRNDKQSTGVARAR